ncbi:MAG TPA: hydrolase [archaeon]|nr:hydrolase [archaeon]
MDEVSMPFTPFHFGPALGFGLPLRKYVHAPTFILANVILDVEPFLVLFCGLRYPLHGYLHTFFLAFFVGLALGYAMFLLEKILHPLYKMFLLESDNMLSLKSFFAAGVLGTTLHVLLDSPLYGEIRPFYPLTINPLYNPALSLEIYSFCVWIGILGIIYYAALLVLLTYEKLSRRQD